MKINKLELIAFLLFFVFVGLQAFHVFVSNTISTGSINAANMKGSIQILEEENTQLKSTILSYSSFEAVSSRAATLGFVEPKSAISLYSPLQVAINQPR